MESVNLPLKSPRAEGLEEWSEVLALAAPGGGETPWDYRVGTLQHNIRQMSVEEMLFFVHRTRETMSDEEIEQHLQGYREDMSEEELRDFLSDFVVEFVEMADADRLKRGDLKQLWDLTVEDIVGMDEEGLSKFVEANIKWDSPLVRRRLFLWTLVIQEGKDVSEEVESVGNQVRGLSQDQMCERLLELFWERSKTHRKMVEKDMLSLVNNSTYYQILEELRAIPSETLSRVLFEDYMRRLEIVRQMVSLKPKSQGTILGRQL